MSPNKCAYIAALPLVLFHKGNAYRYDIAFVYFPFPFLLSSVKFGLVFENIPHLCFDPLPLAQQCELREGEVKTMKSYTPASYTKSTINADDGNVV